MKPHIYHTQFKYFVVIVLFIALFTACKKDLPALPVTGTQGTFCWEQFQNNSFDPVSEWIDTSPNDFPECPTQNIVRNQVNDHRYDMQFAKNNPNILYYILKKCDDANCDQISYHIAKYDFCSGQEKILHSNITPTNLNTGANGYYLHVGEEGEIFFVTNDTYINQGIPEAIYYYSENDMNTFLIDTGLNSAHTTSNLSFDFNLKKIIYNMLHVGSNKYIGIYDLLTQNYDTITNLEDYTNYQYYDSNTWLLIRKDNSDGLFAYDPLDQNIIPVSGVQNESPFSDQKRLVYASNKTYAFNNLRIESFDNNNGSNEIYFYKDNYNDIVINNICLSPDEEHLAANITHQKWISNCEYEDSQYILVFNLQTGDWKAIDFAQ